MSVIPTIKSAHKKKVKEYIKSCRNFLLTSRFNNATWAENQIFRSKHQSVKCIYCSPSTVNQIIPTDSVLFILEMNNDTNKIMGIGMVRNHPICNKYNVYENGNYNRYVYVGKNRIDRSDMTEDEDTIMKVFDILCFTGNRHMKRGQGLTAFPTDMLYRCSKRLDLLQFISDMFKHRISIKEPCIKEPCIKEPIDCIKEPCIKEPCIKEPCIKEPIDCIKEPIDCK